MKNLEIAQMLGVKSRQHVEYVMKGERNFSYSVARKAIALVGGSLDIWMDKDNRRCVSERQRLWKAFKEGLKDEPK